MSDLLSLLGLGANALTAQNAGASVSANNTANVNTPGYSRQRVDLASELAAPLVGGVRSGGTVRLASDLLAGRQRTAAGAAGMSTAYASATADLDQATSGGVSVDSVIAVLFGAIAKVTAAPQDSNLRAQVVASAGDVASSFQARAAQIAARRGDADSRIKDDAGQATALAAQIAGYNKAIKTSDDPTLRDKRDQAAQQLTGLVGGAARIDADGQMRVVLDGGAVMVDGPRAASLATTPDPTTGYARLQVVDGASRRDVTGDLAGGAIGGELAMRDRAGAQAAAALDQLAYDTATAMNTVHRANAGLDGVTGRDLFTAPAAVAGAAAAFTVDPAIAADPSKLATAAAGAGPGNAAGALALLGVADQKVAAGGTRTIGDAAIDLAATVGQTAHDARAASERDTAVADGLTALRDSISGVDVNEELTNLSKFQDAAAAMTKVISTIDSMLGDLIQNL